jgi:hypothetical protein
MKKKVETKDNQTASKPLLAQPAVMRSLLPAIKGGIAGCLNCGYTEDLLPMRTRLYQGFGGWMITKNGEIYFCESHKTEYDEAKTLSYIERRAKLEPECDWRANLDLPLRSAVYQRHGKSKWVLVERGMGFA